MKNWLKRECYYHPYRNAIGFFIVFLSWFAILENVDLPVVWHIHSAVDAYIPFVKYAVIPYCIWYFWFAEAMFHSILLESSETRWRLWLPLFTGLLLILLFCTLVPNSINIRPSYIEGNDLCAILVRAIEGADVPENVCPSMHVYSTMMLDFGVQRAKGYRHKWVKPAARVMDVLICLSTMFLKQHSVIDVLCAVALAIVMDLTAEYAITHERAKEDQKVHNRA